MSADDVEVVLTTCGSQDEADRLAAGLVEERLAACVQTTAIASHYVWDGKPQRDAEVLVLIKTRAALYPRVEAFLRERHSYDLPEVIRLPVHGGLPGYLEWVRERTG